MTICGIKLTHNGGIALIDNDKLIFSYEMEKLGNYPKQSAFCISMNKVNEIMEEYGYDFYKIDSIVIDGCDNRGANELNTGDVTNTPEFTLAGGGHNTMGVMELAGHGHLLEETENILACKQGNTTGNIKYNSYMHVAGHVMAAYCTSPFAHKKEDAFILVWDSDMPPQLFYYRHLQNEVLNLGCLFYFTGNVYTNFARTFEPFSPGNASLPIAAKAMAYTAMGEPRQTILTYYRQLFNELTEPAEKVKVNIEVFTEFTKEFITQAKIFCDANGLAHCDVLASFHIFLQELILENLAKKVQVNSGLVKNFCFTGSSALNNKWNNAIRNSRLFREMWIPPFPNDSGGAIGTACCEMVVKEKISALKWDVYSGPMIRKIGGHAAYSISDCSLEVLAGILHEYNEPIVFMNGRAELGPRALGNRSILAPAVSSEMKEILNDIKGREMYSPLAVVCLEEDAPEIFIPGSRDPYIQYEHHIRFLWKNKMPGLSNADGSVRLQTINKKQNPGIYFLLKHYRKLSGIPLLYNTSANYIGKGFFPDLNSVMEWEKVNFIWHAGKLYSKGL